VLKATFALVDARAHTCMYRSAPVALVYVYVLYETNLQKSPMCYVCVRSAIKHCNTLQQQRTATRCNSNALQHAATATHCNTLQQQRTATRCSALHHVYVLYETKHILRNIRLHEYVVDASAHEYVYIDISIECVRSFFFFFFEEKSFALVDARAHRCM